MSSKLDAAIKAKRKQAHQQQQRRSTPSATGAGKPSSKTPAKVGKKRSAPAPDQQEESDEAEEGSSSDDAESDNEIGLTADAHVRATMKPIIGDQAKSTAAATPAAGSHSKKSKKRKASSGARDDDDDSDGEAAGADSTNELIDVEFGIYDPRPIDYLTTKMILKDYVLSTTAAAAEKKKKKKAKKNQQQEPEEDQDDAADEEMPPAGTSSTPIADDFALHELCDAIVEQVSVGSMVKGEGTEEPLGFATVLSLAWQEQYAKSQDGGRVKWPSQLREYITSRAPASCRAQFKVALEDARTGLLLQGRLINVPPQIVPQLHASLMDDIAWTRANTGAYGEFFAFDQLVLIARQFKPAPGTQRTATQDVLAQAQFVAPFSSSKKKQKKAAAAAAAASIGSAEEWEWLRFEEELYARAATVQYSFACPFTAEDAAAGRQPQSCVVMIIPQAKVAGIVQELQAMAAVI